MTGRQALVGSGGLALVVLNYWTGPGRQAISGGIFAGGDRDKARTELRTFAAELLFVVVATLLAGISDSWGTAMAAVVVALFVLWSINHFAPAQGAKGGAA